MRFGYALCSKANTGTCRELHPSLFQTGKTNKSCTLDGGRHHYAIKRFLTGVSFLLPSNRQDNEMTQQPLYAVVVFLHETAKETHYVNLSYRTC